jgi:hypothetical protein
MPQRYISLSNGQREVAHKFDCCDDVAGLSISPTVGEALAAWIVDGKPPVDLSSMSVTRFLVMVRGSVAAGGRLAVSALLRRCVR